MTKRLRELPAPDGSGKRLSWRTYGITLNRTSLDYACVVDPDGTTRVAYCEETLDYADTFRDLRANPYVEEPKDAVVEAIDNAVGSTGTFMTKAQLSELAATLRPLIRAEVLAGLTVEECVAALVGLGGEAMKRVDFIRHGAGSDSYGPLHSRSIIVLPRTERAK